MWAITAKPKRPGSAKWEEVPEPDVRQGSILVETIAVGISGPDAEPVEGKYGSPLPGETRLILGHESLGVLETDPAGRLKKGRFGGRHRSSRPTPLSGYHHDPSVALMNSASF